MSGMLALLSAQGGLVPNVLWIEAGLVSGLMAASSPILYAIAGAVVNRAQRSRAAPRRATHMRTTPKAGLRE
jgi:hypothetical protein